MPTKQLLAQMRFRPWNGVYLSEEYLASVEGAEQITHRILTQYHDAGVVPLVESRVASVAELWRVERMLEQAAMAPEGSLRHCAAADASAVQTNTLELQEMRQARHEQKEARVPEDSEERYRKRLKQGP